jgi:hypothetical protein
LEEDAQGYIGHSSQTNPPELTRVWKGNPAPSCCLSHKGIITSRGVERNIEEIHVVQEFPYVFPDDLLEMLSERAIEIKIELQLGTAPISKSLYQMMPLELVELKGQLKDLLDKGYIHPSSSPWGCLALFVLKKYKDLRLCVDY